MAEATTQQLSVKSDREEEELEKILTDVSEAWNLTEFQRDQSNESIRFVDVTGAQWEGWVSQQFANRPRMELDQTSQAVNLFNAEWRTGRFGVKYRPDDSKTSEEDAELMNGLFRKDWRRSNGDQSMDNSVNEMSKGGVGAIRLKTEFISEDDPDDKSQKIVFDPIYNAYNTLVWDPQAKSQDKSDALWCALIITYTEDAFKEAYPGKEPDSFYVPLNRNIFNFNNMRLVYVAEYYKVSKRKELAFSYVHKVTGEKKVVFKRDLKEDDLIGRLADSGYKKTGERRITRKSVEKSIISGAGFLSKPRRIIGDRIPISPCYGYRSYVDGQEYYYGLVEKRKDAQRLSNMAISNMAENAATSPKSMPILTPEQVANHETRWSQQHLGKHAYTLLNSLDDQGSPIPLGPIQYTQPNQIDPNTSLILDAAGAFIQNSTGGMPQDVIDPDASGKAINAMINRVDMQTHILMDNISQCLKTVGEIYLGMASQVYDDERFQKIANADDSDKTVLLMEYVLHPKLDKFVRINDVTNMKLEVIVDTGPTFINQRRETVDVLNQLIQSTDSTSPYFPLIYGGIVENMEGPGLENLKKFNKNQMILQGIVKPETEEEEQLVANAQQQQDQPDAATLLAQAEMTKGQADQAEVERKTQADQFKSQNDQGKLQVDTFKAQTDRMAVQVDAQEANATIDNKEIDTFGKQLDNRQKRLDILKSATSI